MTRPRRVPDAAARRLRLLGYVLALLGLLAGTASCADAGRSDTAASHGLVLRAAVLQADVLDALRPDIPPDAAPRTAAAQAADRPVDASPTDGHQADTSPAVASPAAAAPAAPAATPADASPAAGLPVDPPGEVLVPDRSGVGVPLPQDCTSAHTPGGSAGDCPAASERAAAPPPLGAGAWAAHGDGSPGVSSPDAGARCGVHPAPPGALRTPDLHQLQVQRT